MELDLGLASVVGVGGLRSTPKGALSFRFLPWAGRLGRQGFGRASVTINRQTQPGWKSECEWQMAVAVGIESAYVAEGARVGMKWDPFQNELGVGMDMAVGRDNGRGVGVQWPGRRTLPQAADRLSLAARCLRPRIVYPSPRVALCRKSPVPCRAPWNPTAE